MNGDFGPLYTGCLIKKGCQKWMILQVLEQFFAAVQMKIISEISDIILGPYMAHFTSKIYILAFRAKTWIGPYFRQMANIQSTLLIFIFTNEGTFFFWELVQKGGGSSEIKKVPSSSRYLRLKNNDSFSSYEDQKT